MKPATNVALNEFMIASVQNAEAVMSYEQKTAGTPSHFIKWGGVSFHFDGKIDKNLLFQFCNAWIYAALQRTQRKAPADACLATLLNGAKMAVTERLLRSAGKGRRGVVKPSVTALSSPWFSDFLDRSIASCKIAKELYKTHVPRSPRVHRYFESWYSVRPNMAIPPGYIMQIKPNRKDSTLLQTVKLSIREDDQALCQVIASPRLNVGSIVPIHFKDVTNWRSCSMTDLVE